MLRTVIVDDESLARERLRLMLQAEPDVQIVAECRNGQETIHCLRSEQVELLFLDVQMPLLSGLEVARQIGVQHLPPLIFVTAYQEYALQAFELHAVDYLTKPIEKERLRQAIGRFREREAGQNALRIQDRLSAVLDRLQRIETYATRILVREGPKEVFLGVSSIEWIEAADYYSRLHSKGRSYLLRETMDDVAARLDPVTFVRVHRSSIVNLNFVQEIHREGPLEGSLLLSTGRRINVSKSGRQRLLEAGRFGTAAPRSAG
jgi:two-component system, LytTR family, response regulator